MVGPASRALGIAVVGLGHAGSRHARALAAGRISGAALVAVCDHHSERMAPYDAPTFTDASALFLRRDVDAVVIATPHRAHAELAEAALHAGRAVLVEKPLAVETAECSRLLAVQASLGHGAPLLGVVHDYRVDARLLWLKSLLAGGSLGRVERVVWQVTDWFRTDAYYRESQWRGSFSGEGGGLLLNQGSHVFDALCWLFGMPSSVFAHCRFGAFHPIEVEDDVSALVVLPGGAPALVLASTGEAPGANRLEVSCEGGRILVERAAVTVVRNGESARSFAARAGGGRPETAIERREFRVERPSSELLLENFAAALRGEVALLAPAHEAARAVEVANALLWSSRLGRALPLPIDARGYSAFLAELSAGQPSERPLEQSE